MSKDDYRIWSNADLDYEEWKDWMEEEYPTLSDDERVAMMYEENGHYLEDERLNLDIQLSQPILVVADLGLWNGRRMGYKEIPSGNIRDCLYSDYDYTTWYVDRNGDFRCDDTHHDGTNHYLYRVYKDNVSQAQKDRLKEKIYNGTATRADIVRVTRRLGDEIGKVYGWSFPTRLSSRRSTVCPLRRSTAPSSPRKQSAPPSRTTMTRTASPTIPRSSRSTTASTATTERLHR